MNCPICNITLQIAERQGVEIDFCPKCRGIWLDRGELDKIIERAAQDMPARPCREPADQRYERPYDQHHDKRHDSHHDDYRHHKKRSFLHDLFD